MDDRTRLELFNEMFLLILNQLVQNIPYKVHLDPCTVADQMGVKVADDRRKVGGSFTGTGAEKGGFGPLRNGDEFYQLYVATIEYMEKEGFLSRFPQGVAGRPSATGKDAVITAKGTAVLNIPLPGQGKTVSQSIVDVARAGGTDLRQSLISEAVGTIMGAAARGFLGP